MELYKVLFVEPEMILFLTILVCLTKTNAKFVLHELSNGKRWYIYIWVTSYQVFS